MSKPVWHAQIQTGCRHLQAGDEKQHGTDAHQDSQAFRSKAGAGTVGIRRGAGERVSLDEVIQ